ncbi:hypothetical protein ACIRFF_11910 [Streptomyces cyaneofuscatus]
MSGRWTTLELRERGLLSVERRRGFPVRTRCTLAGGGRALRPLLIELYATGEALLAQAHCTES